jgi:hypothetical protein
MRLDVGVGSTIISSVRSVYSRLLVAPRSPQHGSPPRGNVASVKSSDTT